MDRIWGYWEEFLRIKTVEFPARGKHAFEDHIIQFDDQSECLWYFGNRVLIFYPAIDLHSLW